MTQYMDLYPDNIIYESDNNKTSNYGIFSNLLYD